MDAVKNLAVNAKFKIIEKVFTGGYCYKARVDINTVIKVSVRPRLRTGGQLLFDRYVAARLLFDSCEAKIGKRNANWSSHIGGTKIQCYFKQKADLLWFVRSYAQCIDEIAHPASESVLAALMKSDVAGGEETIVYRPSLFFFLHRWRVTLVRRTKWRGDDIALLKDWVNADGDTRLLSEQNVDAKLYVSTQSDVDLVRFGFNHLIRKIEKVILHSEMT